MRVTYVTRNSPEKWNCLYHHSTCRNEQFDGEHLYDAEDQVIRKYRRTETWVRNQQFNNVYTPDYPQVSSLLRNSVVI